MFTRGGRLKLSKDGEFNKNIASLLDDDYTRRRLEFLETKLNEQNVDLYDDIDLKLICEECGSDNVKTVLNLQKFVAKHSSESHCKDDINADVKEVLEFIANALKKKRALNIEDYLTEVVELKLWKLKNTLSTNNKNPDPEEQHVKQEGFPVVPFTSQIIDYAKQIKINTIKNLFGNLFISSPLDGISLVFEDCSLSSCNVSVMQMATKDALSKTMSIVEIPQSTNDNDKSINGKEILVREEEPDNPHIVIFDFDNDNHEMLQQKHVNKKSYNKEITPVVSPILEETEEQFEAETKGDTEENYDNIDEEEEITQSDEYLENEESQVKFQTTKEAPKKADSPNKREIKEALSKFRVCVENFLSSDKEEEEKFMSPPATGIIGDTCPSPSRSKRNKREKLSADLDIHAKRLLEMKVKRQKEKEKKIAQEKMRTQCAKGAYAPVCANSMTSFPLSNKTFYTSIFGGNTPKGPKQKTIFSTNSKNIQIRKTKEPIKEMQTIDRGHSINRCTILETISDCKEEESIADANSPTCSFSKKTLLIKIPSVESCTSKQQINRNINRNIKTECKKNVDKIYSLIEPQRSPNYFNRDHSPEPCSSKQIKGRHLKVKREKPKQEKFDRFEVDRPSIDSLTYRIEEKRCIETKKGKKPQKRYSSPPTREDWNNFYIEEGRKSPNKRLDSLAQPKKSYVEANSEFLRKKALRNVEMERLLDTKRSNGAKKVLINSDSYTTTESIPGSNHSRRKTTDKETLKQVINSCKSTNMIGYRRECRQNSRDRIKTNISATSIPYIDLDVRTSVESIVDVDDVTPRPNEKYACGEGVSILYKNIDLMSPRKCQTKTEDIPKNEQSETTTNKMIIDYGTGDSLSVELVQMSKEITTNVNKESSFTDEKKDLIENLSKALQNIEKRKLQKFKQFCSLFWPAGDASISTVNTFAFSSFFDQIATPILTVAYSFPAHDDRNEISNNSSIIEPLRHPIEHDIPTEIYNRNLPRNESSDLESVSTSDATDLKQLKEGKPPSRNVDVGNDRSETACIQTGNVFHEDKVVYVDFPEREFISRCVNVQSIFLKPEYLKNHPSLEALFREGSKMVVVSKSEQNFKSSNCRISPSMKKMSVQNVPSVESHPLIEMFKRPTVKPDATTKPNKAKVQKQKRFSRKPYRVMHKEKGPNDMKKRVLLAVYTVLVMSVFAAMSYPDVLVLQNSV